MDRKLYIIAGCNGAGKTTVSFTLLPKILSCKEFVNADEIAKGLSPFQPNSVSFEAGRIMLKRIDDLLANKTTFAFETTLATRSYPTKIRRAQENGYRVILLFFWLNSVELALDRVSIRVSEGGHNIEPEIIKRRYSSEIKNLFDIYLPIVDEVMIFDNSGKEAELLAEKNSSAGFKIYNTEKWTALKKNI